MFSVLVEVLQPINCILVSEEIPSITIVLSERRNNSLKGQILSDKRIKGDFYTQKPSRKKNATWIFKSSNINFNGEILLFKDEELWHQYQNNIEGNQVNRVIFSGLAMKLAEISSEINLLKGTSGFFSIGNECYGGKINKAFYKVNKDSLAGRKFYLSKPI